MDEPLILTTSVGVAHAPVATNGGDNLLQRADGALMGAKNSGRDLVVVAE